MGEVQLRSRWRVGALLVAVLAGTGLTDAAVAAERPVALAITRIPQGPAPEIAPEAAPFPYEQTFKLHSRPGAQRVIYLDFDGAAVSGTAWNHDYNNDNAFTATAFDSDGAPGSFSTGEMDLIQGVWQRVAEDFAPLAVDITTEDPGLAAIDRSGTGDEVYGATALISNSSPVATSCDCAGIAYVGVYSNPSDHQYFQPALVFPADIQFNEKWVAETVSHEVGHNLGLLHDKTSDEEYYDPASGPWAPIMGESFYRPLSQWDRGEFDGALNTQNDFTVMASHGGPPVADDVGNTTAAATALGGASPFNTSGLISTATDLDVFSFTAAAGQLTLTASPAPRSPNLDIKLELLSSAGAVLATSNPATAMQSQDVATGLGASITKSVAAGNYFARIRGVGQGNPSAAPGYSNFGSVGRYTLTGAVSGGGGGTTVSIVDLAKFEGASGATTNFGFVVKLNAASSQTVTVKVTTATNGSAAVPGDFAAKTQTITFQPGDVKKTFVVKVKGDGAKEPNETFLVNLTAPTGGATIADGQAQGTIKTDD